MPETDKMITEAELEKLYASVGPGGETLARTVERNAALETFIQQVRRHRPEISLEAAILTACRLRPDLAPPRDLPPEPGHRKPGRPPGSLNRPKKIEL